MASLGACAQLCLHLWGCMGRVCADNFAAKRHSSCNLVPGDDHGPARAKGSLVCHAGLHGNERKSFLLRPEGVFVAPPARSSFLLMGLERARLALLDDWRFNEDIIPSALQLPLFEGAPFIISPPQNQFSGHLRYAKDDPVFITTLQSDHTELKGKKMVLKRLLVFNFTKPIAIPKPVVQGCAHCFAHFLVSHPLLRIAVAPSSAAATPQHPPVSVEDAESWSVADVVSFLHDLSLGT